MHPDDFKGAMTYLDPSPYEIWDMFNSSFSNNSEWVKETMSRLSKEKAMEVLAWFFRCRPAPEVLDFLNLVTPSE